ncbi:alpha/beta fold hydrolase [Burkholderia sp. Bp9031]|uniref:alpha/beta fold hydrolase n=1 Tax=Burkholderia sp. Bp9031 TaxID=2184566 RepID=UPI001C89249F|nr:hypothetical protein [Burkholderia sp. Bp9031]
MKPDSYLSPDDAGRRDLMLGGVLATVAAMVPNAAAAATDCAPKPTAGAAGARIRSSDRITTKDGVEIYYKEWGPKDGQVVTLSHGWPLCSDRKPCPHRVAVSADSSYRLSPPVGRSRIQGASSGIGRGFGPDRPAE